MPTVSLELCQVKPQGLLDQHDAVTSPGASVGAACGPSLFTNYFQPVWVSLRSERKPHRLCPSQQWCVHSGLPLQPQTSHQHGNSSWWKGAAPLSPGPPGVSGAGSVTISGLKVSVSVLLRALCYHCALPCAARLQLLNLVVKEQQAASWQGTFCSFLVYLSIPSDQVLGNN